MSETKSGGQLEKYLLWLSMGILLHIARCRYIAAQYILMSYGALQWQGQYIVENSNCRKTPHTSLALTGELWCIYRSIFEEIDRVLTAPQCSIFLWWQCCDQSTAVRMMYSIFKRYDERWSVIFLKRWRMKGGMLHRIWRRMKNSISHKWDEVSSRVH